MGQPVCERRETFSRQGLRGSMVLGGSCCVRRAVNMASDSEQPLHGLFQVLSQRLLSASSFAPLQPLVVPIPLLAIKTCISFEIRLLEMHAALFNETSLQIPYKLFNSRA